MSKKNASPEDASQTPDAAEAADASTPPTTEHAEEPAPSETAKTTPPNTYESFDAEAEAAEEAALDGARQTADAGDAAPDGATEPALEEPSLEAGETLEDVKAKLAVLEDQLYRSVADFQNLRRRADKERKDAETYGGAKLARDMLSVYDNLAAALAQASDAVRETEAPFMNGLDLTRKELLNVFAKHGIQPVDPEIGERFDPNLHQAMYEQPTDEVEPGAVVNVMQSGFMIGERLLRPAMVGVAKAKEAASG